MRVFDLRRPPDAPERRPGTGMMMLAIPALWALSPCAQAQTNPQEVTGPLVQLVQSAPPGTFNQLEQLSAIANQASYNVMLGGGPKGIQCDPGQTGPTTTCNGDAFQVFRNLRGLIQSANELLNNGGPTFYSLHTSLQGLGFALRWTAGENLLAPGSAATQFASGQLSSISGRLAALRLGLTGFSLGGYSQPGDTPHGVVASRDEPGPAGAVGGGAGDGDIGLASRWGGFFDAPYGWGYRSPSVVEDAFGFDSRDVTIGVDYRFTRRLVAGVSGGFTDERADFDETASVAGGGFRARGFGGSIYAQYEWERGPYLSAVLGWQSLGFHETRKVTYPSFNIYQPSADATADGNAGLTNLMASVSTGWVLDWSGTTFEPYLNADYRVGRLDAFTETSQSNPGAEAAAAATAGYGLSFAAQTFRVLDATAGVRVQHAFPTPVGVVVPYARLEYHHDYLENSYAVVASYASLGSGAPSFYLPADPINSGYGLFAGGVLVVLPHGLQAYAQYQSTTAAPYVVSRQTTVSIRGEF